MSLPRREVLGLRLLDLLDFLLLLLPLALQLPDNDPDLRFAEVLVVLALFLEGLRLPSSGFLRSPCTTSAVDMTGTPLDGHTEFPIPSSHPSGGAYPSFSARQPASTSSEITF